MNYLAKVFNKDTEAKKLIGVVENKFATVQSELPEIQGKTYNFIWYGADSAMRYMPGFPLEQFGLKPSETQNNTVDNIRISRENLSQIDGDIVVVTSSDENRPKIKEDELWNQQPVVKRGTVIYVDNRATQVAMTQTSPKSEMWLADKLEPQSAEIAPNLR